MIFYNVLSGRKEKLKPIKDKLVRLYTCGPTVYDFAHVGNFKTYLFEDLLRRAIKYNGYKVYQVMNLTDVEDKIIKRAKAEGKSIKAITGKYTKVFFADIKKLNIERVEVYPKATAHIKEMLQIIGKLLKKGLAYKGQDNSIYFDISKFKNYGRLSRLKQRQIKVGARVASDEYDKEEAQDFVLWKARKPGEPFWKSPFGEGRPGWHIECSAMSMKYLGSTFDIHTGAVDLIFPHHENEIAQSEGATGKKFVNIWLEGEHILINGEKMSKSLKNFLTLRDLEAKSFDPLSFRYLVLCTHYRKKLNFTWQALKGAENALMKLRRLTSGIPPAKEFKVAGQSKRAEIGYRRKFLGALNNDLNIPQALGVLWQALADNRLPPKEKKALIYDFDRVLGLGLKRIKPKKVSVPAKVKELVARREKFRVNKQFIQADALRKKIEALGYRVEDNKNEPRILNAKN